MSCIKSQLHFRLASVALAVFMIIAVAGIMRAEEVKQDAIVASLLTKDLVGIPDKEVVMLTVEYLPGGASRPHRHDANVFLYVLEGTLLTRVDGQDPVTLKPGQTFYESPQDIHRQSANASRTEPVKFLVFMVKEKGKPATRPVDGN